MARTKRGPTDAQLAPVIARILDALTQADGGAMTRSQIFAAVNHHRFARAAIARLIKLGRVAESAVRRSHVIHYSAKQIRLVRKEGAE